MLVRYLGETTPWGLEHGEFCRVLGITQGMYRIEDWFGKEELYTPELFEVLVDDMREIRTEIQCNQYKVLGLNDAAPIKNYNMYSIDGIIYEPVTIYDAVNCIAIESTGSFIGKTVTFISRVPPRAPEINEHIFKTQKCLFRLRRTSPGTNNACSYVVTLRKMHDVPLERRVEDFEECLRDALIQGEEMECANRCYTVQGGAYSITYCLEAYNNHAHIRGHSDNGRPEIELLHRMGYEECHRWVRRNCSEGERTYMDRQMLSKDMKTTYPNPADRFHAIVQSIKAKYKRDPRVDGEYDRPLPLRKETLTEEDKLNFRIYIHKFKTRAEAAGRPTAVYDEMEKELDNMEKQNETVRKVSQEFLDEMIAEAGSRYKNALICLANDGWTEEQLRDWVDSL